jgi:hypothetical protein
MTLLPPRICYSENRGRSELLRPLVLPLSAKSLGEWAELLFMQECRRRGFQVARPFGDTATYDVLVERAGRIARVQVKCVSRPFRSGYKVLAARGSSRKIPYTRRDLDFLAALIVPIGAWYIIPARALRRRISLWLFPSSRSSRSARYRNAWHLLR